MKRLLILLIGIVALSCCLACHRSSNRAQIAAIIKFLADSNDLDKVDYSDDIITQVPYLKDSRYLLYVLNASCSTCIVEYLRFEELLTLSDVDIPLYVIVNEFYLDRVQYFRDKTEIKPYNHMRFVSLPQEYPFVRHKIPDISMVIDDKISKSIFVLQLLN